MKNFTNQHFSYPSLHLLGLKLALLLNIEFIHLLLDILSSSSVFSVLPVVPASFFFLTSDLVTGVIHSFAEPMKCISPKKVQACNACLFELHASQREFAQIAINSAPLSHGGIVLMN